MQHPTHSNFKFEDRQVCKLLAEKEGTTSIYRPMINLFFVGYKQMNNMINKLVFYVLLFTVLKYDIIKLAVILIKTILSGT